MPVDIPPTFIHLTLEMQSVNTFPLVLLRLLIDWLSAVFRETDPNSFLWLDLLGWQ